MRAPERRARLRPTRFHEQFPVTAFLLLLNLAFFALEVIQHLKYSRQLGQPAELIGINSQVLHILGWLSWQDLSKGQYWRIVSAAFLHGGVLHIIFNLLMLSDLGRYCETFLSSWKFLVAYGVGILGSAAGSMVVGQLRGVPVASVGASGAICSLFGLLLVYSLKARQDELRDRLIRSVLWIVVITMFVPANVDHGAHLGGFIAGGIFGLAVNDYMTSREALRWRYPALAVSALGITCLGFAIWNYFSKR